MLARILAIMSAVAAAADAAAQGVGVSEWVNPNAWRAPAAAASRDPLQAGLRVNEDDTVQTDPRGASDFVFDLGSRLLIGPLCEVVLDETYYDPRLDDVVGFDMYAQTVCVVRAAAAGETIVLRTPVATVTISGLQATIVYANPASRAAPGGTGSLAFKMLGGKNVQLAAVLDAGIGGAGSVEVVSDRPGGGRSEMSRPGSMILISSDGSVSGPLPVTTELLVAVADTLDGLAGIFGDVPPWAPSPNEALREERRFFDRQIDVCTLTSFCDTFDVEIEIDLEADE